MKKILLTLLSTFLLTQLYAQGYEFSVLANCGLFHYSGNNTVSSSFFNGAVAGSKAGYTNNPYGNENAFSYGADFQAQHVAASGFIFGLQAGYDVLRSKVDITSVYTSNSGVIFYNINGGQADENNPPTKGQAYLQSGDINLNPYVGYRFRIKNVKIDLLPGIDMGFNVNTHEYGKATDNSGNVYKTDLDRGKMTADFRLQFGTAVWYKRFGIMANYAHGIVNFSSDLLNDSPTTYTTNSNVFRFGIIYRLVN
jgi:hypothetical protein